MIDPDDILRAAGRQDVIDARTTLPTPDIDDLYLEGERLYRRVTWTPASAIPVRRVRWLWQLRLALGTLGLLAGTEGQGKSTLAYELAARITRGQLAGEYQQQPKGVIVCATEDSWSHTVVPRLMAHDADLDRVYRVEVELHDGIYVGLSLPADLHDTEVCALDTDAALLILDPLMSRLDAKLDSHKDGEVRRALEPMVALADKVGMAVLGLIHHNKSGSTDPLALVMASKAFTAVARSVHTVVPDPEDETGQRKLFGTPKNNLGRTDLPTLTFTISGWTFQAEDGEGITGKLTWGEDSTTTIHDALRSITADPETRSNTDEALAWLIDYLSIDEHAVVASKDVRKAAKDAGHGIDALKRARTKGGISSTPWGFPRRTYWARKGMTPNEVHAWLDSNAAPTTQSGDGPVGAQKQPPSDITPGHTVGAHPGESAPTALIAPTGNGRTSHSTQSVQSVQSVQSEQSPRASHQPTPGTLPPLDPQELF